MPPRRDQKRNPKKFRKRDPGIPNSWPFKQQLLMQQEAQREAAKQQMIAYWQQLPNSLAAQRQVRCLQVEARALKELMYAFIPVPQRIEGLKAKIERKQAKFLELEKEWDGMALRILQTNASIAEAQGLLQSAP